MLCNPKFPHNVGNAVRTLSCFGLENLVWTGARVEPEKLDRLPREERMKGYKEVKWQRTQRPFDMFKGDNVPVCVELHPGAQSLVSFEHPEDAVYLFGPEDGEVPQVLRRFCHHFVFIPTHHCLNLATAVTVVLYDRRAKRQLAGIEEMLPMDQILHEPRGQMATPGMDAVGWDGK